MPRFTTTESGIARWLIHKGLRCQTALTAEGRVQFAFIDSPQLQTEIESYLTGAMVEARLYEGAGRVVRRLILDTRRRATEASQP